MENKLILGDNLEILKTMPSDSVDLCYIDPPFFSNKNYEVIWGDNGEVASFKDRWSGGIDHYINWLYERVIEIHRVLKTTGSFYLHCDWHADAYIRVNILDKIFGVNNFMGDIVWKRTSAHNDAKNKLAVISDTIWYYSKSNKFTYHPTYVDYNKNYLEKFYRHKDSRGIYRLCVLTGPGINPNDVEWREYHPKIIGRSFSVPTDIVFKLAGENGKKLSTTEKLELLEKNDYIVWSKNKIPEVKKYLDKSKGVLLANIWTDIFNVQGKERIGYPTQKPVTLLERIIKASSNEGDVVMDCFCGGGTTIAVANKLNRKFIGIDQSVQAIKVTQARLERDSDLFTASFAVVTHKYDYDTVRYSDAFEFERFIIEQFGGEANIKQRSDSGVDGAKKVDKISIPIQVKRSDSVGAPTISNFVGSIHKFYSNLNKAIPTNIVAGYIIAFSFSKGAVEEVARLKLKEKFVIELVKVEDIIPIVKKPKVSISYKLEKESSKDNAIYYVSEISSEIQTKEKENDKKEITFKVRSDNGNIELYQWDFDYSKEKWFKAEVMIDKEGIQKKVFKKGSYNIAVRAIDVDGMETIEEIKLIINGGVKISK